MNKSGLIIAILMGSIILLFIASKVVHSGGNELPQKVVESFFECLDTKNTKKAESYLLDKNKKYFANTDNVESVKIISVEEDTNLKNGYIQEHWNDKLDPNNVMVFKVDYNIKYKDDSKVEPNDSGKISTCITLVRKTEKSKWLIAAWGF